MSIRTAAIAMTVAGLALTACGSNTGDSTTTTQVTGSASSASSSTPAASSSSSSMSSTSSSSTSAGGAGTYNAGKCVDAAGAMLNFASSGLDVMSGQFDQAAFDKAFPAGVVDKLPEELKAGYTEVESAAKSAIGATGDKAIEVGKTLSDKTTALAKDLERVCTP